MERPQEEEIRSVVSRSLEGSKLFRISCESDEEARSKLIEYVIQMVEVIGDQYKWRLTAVRLGGLLGRQGDFAISKSDQTYPDPERDEINEIIEAAKEHFWVNHNIQSAPVAKCLRSATQTYFRLMTTGAKTTLELRRLKKTAHREAKVDAVIHSGGNINGGRVSGNGSRRRLPSIGPEIDNPSRYG